MPNPSQVANTICSTEQRKTGSHRSVIILSACYWDSSLWGYIRKYTFTYGVFCPHLSLLRTLLKDGCQRHVSGDVAVCRSKPLPFSSGH